MQCIMHFSASNIALKGLVTADDKTLELHVKNKNGMLHGNISTNNTTLKAKHTIWVLTSPCVLS